MLKQIAKNTGVIAVGNTLSRIISLFIFIALARYLGVAKLGEYSFIFVYLYFFDILIQFGMNPIITREISRDKSKADIIMGNTLLIRTAFILTTMILSCAIITFLKYPVSTKLLVYLASLSLFLNLRNIYEAIFKVNLAMVYPSVLSVVKKLLYGLMCVLIILLKGTLVHLIFATLITGFVDLLLMIYFSRRYALPKFKFNASICKFLVRESLPLTFSAAFTVIYSRVDIFMLSLIKGYESVGYYSSAYNLTEALRIIPIAVVVSLFPLLSNYFNKLKDNFTYLVRRTSEFMLLGCLPIAIGTTFLAPKIILFLYGNRYFPAASCLTILIWVNVFMFLTIIVLNALIAANRQIVDTYVSLFAAVLNILLNLVFIPRYDFNGAAIATGITEFFNLIFVFYYINRLTGLRVDFRFVGKVLAANLIFILLLVLIHTLPLLLVIVISVIFYSSLILMFRIVTKDDVRNFKKALVPI